MMILKVVITSLASILTLFFLSKLMGYRQMSQMSLFDYINGITFGSIAAEMATSVDKNPWYTFTAMVVYALVAVFLSIITDKSLFLSKFINGYPILLLDNGQLFYNNFKRAKIDIEEFQIQCRMNGYFDLSTIQTALLEPNGSISFLSKSQQKPASPSDLEINVPQEYMVLNVIIDGKVIKKNLTHQNLDEVWLQKQLSDRGYPDFSSLLLVTCSYKNELTLYEKQSSEIK